MKLAHVLVLLLLFAPAIFAHKDGHRRPDGIKPSHGGVNKYHDGTKHTYRPPQPIELDSGALVQHSEHKWAKYSFDLAKSGSVHMKVYGSEEAQNLTVFIKRVEGAEWWHQEPLARANGKGIVSAKVSDLPHGKYVVIVRAEGDYYLQACSGKCKQICPDACDEQGLCDVATATCQVASNSSSSSSAPNGNSDATIDPIGPIWPIDDDNNTRFGHTTERPYTWSSDEAEDDQINAGPVFFFFFFVSFVVVTILILACNMCCRARRMRKARYVRLPAEVVKSPAPAAAQIEYYVQPSAAAQPMMMPVPAQPSPYHFHPYPYPYAPAHMHAQPFVFPGMPHPAQFHAPLPAYLQAPIPAPMAPLSPTFAPASVVLQARPRNLP